MRRAAEREGYVLPTTLAAIAVISIVIATAAQQVRSSNRSTSQIGLEADFSLSAQTAEQRFVYLLSASPMGATGPEIGGARRMNAFLGNALNQTGGFALVGNGTPYRFEDQSLVIRYFDEQSFLNVSDWQSNSINILFDALDVPPGRRQGMAAALADYQDADSIPQFGGGEAEAYERRSLPANRKLRSPLEICDVNGWGESSVCEDKSLILLIGDVRDSSHLSPMLANPVLLSLLSGSFGDTEDIWRDQQAGGLSFAQAGQPALDRASSALGAPTPPRARFSVIVHDPDARFIQRSDYVLTPGGRNAPFGLRARYRLSGTATQDFLRLGQDSRATSIPLPFLRQDDS